METNIDDVVNAYLQVMKSSVEFANMIADYTTGSDIYKITPSGNINHGANDKDLVRESIANVYLSGEGLVSTMYLGVIDVGGADIANDVMLLNSKKDLLKKLHTEYVKAGGSGKTIASAVYGRLSSIGFSYSPDADKTAYMGKTPSLKQATRKIVYYPELVESLSFYKRPIRRVEKVTLEEAEKAMLGLGDEAKDIGLRRLASANKNNLRYVYDSNTVRFYSSMKLDGKWKSSSASTPFILGNSSRLDYKGVNFQDSDRAKRSDAASYELIVKSLPLFEKMN